MDKIIGVTQLQRNFRAVFDKVVNERIPFVLTRGSRPEAVIIPYDQYLQYVQANENQVHARFDALLERMTKVNARYSDEQVERDINRVSRIVRARRRARSKRQGDSNR